MMFFDSFALQIRPRPRTRMLDWCRTNVQNENGRPYDHLAYPHLGAPGGPCDAFDDPLVRVIALQFASRLGKTFFGQCAHLFTAGSQPAPCMFVSASEKIAGEIIARTYTLLSKCRALSGELPREDRRKQDCIELANCRIFVGWARSVVTLADKNVKVGHANEIDKWERFTTRMATEDGQTVIHGSTEGDPLDLFLDRAKDFPNYKYILESTPAVAGGSRIERARLASSNCSMFVPCPFCRQYQTLKFERLKWEKGQHDYDSDLAYRTAHYPCEHCGVRLEDHHRAGMMRLGVWLPEGTGIDHAIALETAQERQQQLNAGTFSDELPGHYCQQPYVVGEPRRDGLTAGYQLSSLYALSLTWGTIAAKWVDSLGNQTSLWNFVNQWKGETWKLDRRSEDWEAVGKRLVIATPRTTVPNWAAFLTCGIDRQMDHYKYLVCAWGPGSACHVLDYGTSANMEWIHQFVVSRDWFYADGDKIRIAKTLVDSGYDPAEPYHYSLQCLTAGLVVMCCKGSSTQLDTPFRETILGDATLMPGLPVILVDTNWTQGELERRLYRLRPGDDGALTVFGDSLEGHKDFLKQIVNDEPQSKKNARGNPVIVWNRVSDYPNDYRDCLRYADVAHLMWSDGAPIPTREHLKQYPLGLPATSGPRLHTEDGRPYLISERSS